MSTAPKVSTTPGLLALFSAAVALLPARAAGQAADTLVLSDLPGLVESVRAANPMLHSMRAAADALGQRPAQVGALPDPMVGVAWLPVPIVTARGSQRTQWQVQQAIPFPGKLSLRAEAAEWAAVSADADAETVEQDLVERAKHAFFELDRVLRQQALVREFARTLRGFEEVARTRYEVGAGLQQAILKAQLERNALQNRLIDLSRTRRTLLERLSNLVNRPVALRDSVLQTPRPVTVEAEAAALDRVARLYRPEMKSLDAALGRSATQVELARKEWLPDFGVAVTWFDIADRDMPPTADGTNALAVGVTARIPLQRGRLRAQLEESRLMERQVEARREALETSIRTDLADLSYQVTSATEQLSLFSDALIPQASTTLAATLSAYTTGRAGFLDLLDAERMLFDLRWSYESVRATLLKAGASLERVLGVSDLSDIDF